MTRVFLRTASHSPEDHCENRWHTVTRHAIRGFGLRFGPSCERSLKRKPNLQAHTFCRFLRTLQHQVSRLTGEKGLHFFSKLASAANFFLNKEKTDPGCAGCIWDDVRAWHYALVQHDTKRFLRLWSNRLERAKDAEIKHVGIKAHGQEMWKEDIFLRHSPENIVYVK